MREIIRPTVQGMAADGIRYTGFLDAGLMISHGADGKPIVACRSTAASATRKRSRS